MRGADGGEGRGVRSEEERLQRRENMEGGGGGTKDLQMKERRDD